MSRRLGVGMVGAGFIGQIAHLWNFAQVKECRLVALAEMRPELRALVAARYGIAKTYATHRDLLKDPAVEAVVVVTPRAHTGPVALDCLNAGKHVLTEKPMAGRSEDGKRLVDAARKHKVNYAVGYMKRYDEGVRQAKRILDDLLASGRLGSVQFVRAHCFMGGSYCNADGHVVTDEKADYADGGWPMAPKFVAAGRRADYEAYINTYGHTMNLLRWFFGRTPRADYADFRKGAGQIAVLDFGDFRATLETGRSTSRDWDELVEVYFADGKLSLKLPPALLRNVPARVELYSAGTVQEVRSPQCDWTWSFRRQATAFVGDILKGRASESSGEDALEDLRLAEMLWRLDAGRAKTPA